MLPCIIFFDNNCVRDNLKAEMYLCLTINDLGPEIPMVVLPLLHLILDKEQTVRIHAAQRNI